MAVKMLVLVFWVVMLCGPIGGCQHLRGTQIIQNTMIDIIYQMFVMVLVRIIKPRFVMCLFVTKAQTCCHGIVYHGCS
jgi:hypothetical protein